MTLRIVRLGSPRARGEGLRIGTVRRPPRGVPKHRYSKDDWYDVWLPVLAPSAELLASGATEAQLFRRFRAEMKAQAPRQTLELLAALSHHTNLSIGCYCEDEAHCHRHVLRELLEGLGADIR
jgi:uncharacterized protein YeaO (DUF488 family)